MPISTVDGPKRGEERPQGLAEGEPKDKLARPGLRKEGRRLADHCVKRTAPVKMVGETPTLHPYRLENWKDRRAFARPYFLRSTTRESLVRNPLLLSTGRRSGS